ncbi:MAG: hypothetical protein GY715_09495 [Planctomycetes bacterium]|nr:hypothetical protein [Planctomycetota bacterium]
MPRPETSSRSSSLVLTASTLVAIAAMAAGARAAHTVPALSVDQALRVTEVRGVRGVAAVVAAAARDLLAAEQTTAALPATGLAVTNSVDECLAVGLEVSARCFAVDRLGEHLLDLPPPTG